MGSGYIQEGFGWIQNTSAAEPNCTEGGPTTLFATVDATTLGVSTTTPRIFKNISYDICGGTFQSVVSTIPILTLIVSLEKGRVAYIAWDDGCFTCASNTPACMNNALDTGTWEPVPDASFAGCAQDATTCFSTSVPTTTVNASSVVSGANLTDANLTDANATNATTAALAANGTGTGGLANASSLPSSSCDLKIFISWTGTDSAGNYLTSSSKRFSRFRQYGTATAYQSAVNLGTDGFNTAISTLGLVDGVPGRLIPGSVDGRRRLGLAQEEAQSWTEFVGAADLEMESETEAALAEDALQPRKGAEAGLRPEAHVSEGGR